MKVICKKCNVEKELNENNFKWNYINGKKYFEKTCKKCRQIRANEQRKERYNNDEDFRNKVLNNNQKWLNKIQKERGEQWRNRRHQQNQWVKNNPNKIKKINQHRHKRRWNDPIYKINKLTSNKINAQINNKNNSVFKLLGYSLEELMNHLEAQFEDGMTWDNHGKWHIDHIKPICSFKFESYEDEEFKECWALSNLRPLWAKDNLKKSIKDKKLKK